TDLLPAINVVHAATGLPLLSPTELRAVLTGLSADLEQQPFHLAETGKRVRDRCREGEHAVSRADVGFVLKGILLGGHSFGEGVNDPKRLALSFVNSVRELCRREQLQLDDQQVSQLREWAKRASDSRGGDV
ncbi:conserved hypothetical protein, partial [sediment metagenome]